jgi:hypothetical protein
MGCGLSHLIGLNPTGTGSPAKNKNKQRKGEIKNKETKYRVGAIWQKAADILGWYNAVTPDGTASAVPNCVCRAG